MSDALDVARALISTEIGDGDPTDALEAFDAAIDATRKGLWDTIEKAEADKLEAEKRADALEARLEKMRDNANATIDKLEAEVKRLGKDNGDLRALLRHAKETLDGVFDPPTIDEIRSARGLEPLGSSR